MALVSLVSVILILLWQNHIFGFWTFACTKQCFKMSSLGPAACEVHTVTICLQTIIIIIFRQNNCELNDLFLKKKWLDEIAQIRIVIHIFSLWNRLHEDKKMSCVWVHVHAWMCEHVTITSQRTSLSQQIRLG